MKQILLLSLFVFCIGYSYAGNISGTVKDTEGKVLPFASIVVKGTSKGAVANSAGKYNLTLEPGNYTLLCQFVGFTTVERTVTLGKENLVIDFVLTIQELQMEEVIIKSGEDPAIEIMRQTIAKRNYHNNLVDSFTVDVYIKGLMRSRAMPDKLLGVTIDKGAMKNEGIDSTGKGILFLSESVTKVSFTRPDKLKYNVISTRESGGGYGISFPFFINFYVNNVSLFTNTNPRGFISPIADNAFHYYRFRFEGSFFEGNKMINRIRVTPKRKNEPLFEGYIQIVDDRWMIHSLELTTTKDYQLEMLDTVRISQIHAPVYQDAWKTHHQVVYVAVNMFGFDMVGNFLNVYSNYNINPGFDKKYFNRIVMAYDSTATKKDSSYWAQVRPILLEPDEKRNFVFKDSISKATRDSSFSRLHIDSLKKARKPVQLKKFFFGGVTRQYYSGSAFSTYKFNPLIKELEYNTVEGLVINLVQSFNVYPRKGKHNLGFSLDARYGISNSHFNAFMDVMITPKTKRHRKRFLLLSGGRRVSQFNHDNPIDALTNSLYTLLAKKNYMKIYENWFGKAEYRNQFESGLQWRVSMVYEDRIPVENTTSYSFFNKENTFLPNHPFELANIPFPSHQALVASATISWQPGQYYIQFPTYKQAIGSDFPTFEIQYDKGFNNILGSDVDFDQWRFSVFDKMNLKLAGEFHYRLSAGGFLNDKKVGLPDMRHFNGNQTFYNFKYLNSFQLAPYYQYSNTERIYGLAHVEHHFNGLLTNKIPLFNKLKWNLVAGANIFFVNSNNYYLEAFAGLENIFKFFRIDLVTAYQAQPGRTFGVRVGLGGILGGSIRFSSE